MEHVIELIVAVVIIIYVLHDTYKDLKKKLDDHQDKLN